MAQRRHRIRQPLTPQQKRQRMARRRVARRFRKIDEQQTRGPRTLVFLLCLLAFAGVMYKVFGPESSADDAEIADGSEQSQAASSAGRLDPEPLRADIERLEVSLLTARDASSLDDLASTIALDASSFADRLRAVDDARHRDLAERVGQLGTRAAEGLDLDGLAALRRDWVSIRNSALKGAAWFRGETVSLAQDAGVRAVYRDVASDLLNLAEEARYEAESLADEARQGTDVSARWQDYVSGFREQIRDIRWSLPEERPRADSSASFMTAVQTLETSIERVERGITGAPTPSATFDLSHYEKAVDTARSARDRLSELD